MINFYHLALRAAEVATIAGNGFDPRSSTRNVILESQNNLEEVRSVCITSIINKKNYWSFIDDLE